MNTTHYTHYTAHWKLNNVHCTVHNTQGTLNTVYCILYIYRLYIEHWTQHTVHYPLDTSLHCTTLRKGPLLSAVLNLTQTENLFPYLVSPRASKTHGHAKFSRICAKLKLLNTELAIQALFHIFGTIWLGFFQILQVFIAIFVHNSAQSLIKLNSDRAKTITFKRSGFSQTITLPISTTPSIYLFLSN